MATLLHHVRENFIYQLESITPTNQQVTRGFRNVDTIRLGAQPDERDSFGNASGRARDFIVRRMACPDIDNGVTRAQMREAVHIYQVTFGYPTAIGDLHIHKMMDQDRHDVILRLRDSVYFVGITGASTQACGLHLRRRLSDELDDSGKVWLQTFVFDCLIREEEY